MENAGTDSMTDSRAALEERARELFPSKDWFGTPQEVASEIADFVEQESSSLKLLIRAICAEKAEFWPGDDFKGAALWIHRSPDEADSYPVELDSSGIPVITEEILKALEAAK